MCVWGGGGYFECDGTTYIEKKNGTVVRKVCKSGFIYTTSPQTDLPCAYERPLQSALILSPDNCKNSLKPDGKYYLFT